jgi:hypothetical protein
VRIAEGFIKELEQEEPATRRVLERVPQAKLSWKPHARSMSLGQLALHVATIPGNVAALVARDVVPEPGSGITIATRRTCSVLSRQPLLRRCRCYSPKVLSINAISSRCHRFVG